MSIKNNKNWQFHLIKCPDCNTAQRGGKMIKCCDEEMLISGEWYHCRKCNNRLIRCLHGEEKTVLANMIVEHTNEYNPTWGELQHIFHELWKQGHYEEYEPDVPDNWNTSIECAEPPQPGASC